MPELRRDPITARWVIIGTERIRRPGDFATTTRPRFAGPCGLCAGHEHESPPALLEVGDAKPPTEWRVRVVPNRFPALRIEAELERHGHGIYDVISGVGAHEIIVESPRHDDALATLGPAAVEDVVRAWHSRIDDLRRDPRLRSIVLVKSHRAGGTAAHDHPHSQLIAAPTPPPSVEDELHHARAYHRWRERCPFCDVLHAEADEGSRIIVATEHVVVFAPFAAEAPFAMWILPRRHAPGYERATAAELRDFAVALRSALRRLSHTLGDPPYTLSLHTAPVGEAESPYYHWHAEITPRLPSPAGVESNGAFAVNPLPPEDAARYLRDAAD